MGVIRLYIEGSLAVGQKLELNEAQCHYLGNVMKLKARDTLSCFDNKNGEFGCEVDSLQKKHAVLNVVSHDRPFVRVPDIWLLFAPVKKDNTDFIIQKSVELGVRKIVPVLTTRTIADKIRLERFNANAIEAAEQCRRTDIPEISEAVRLDKLLQNWDASRTIYFMDETLQGRPVSEVFADAPAPCAVLIGPEGGFSAEELELLRALPFARGVNLGNRILRAETAVVAALSCWQALNGDWR